MVYNVKPEILIERLADELDEVEEIEPPEWAEHAKDGVTREQAPQQDDWWQRRGASLLRKLYVDGPKGVRRLSKEYGGKHGPGPEKAHHRSGSRNVVRTALQQLEDAGYVETVEGKGRRLTPEGRSFLDGLSNELAVEA